MSGPSSTGRAREKWKGERTKRYRQWAGRELRRARIASAKRGRAVTALRPTDRPRALRLPHPRPASVRELSPPLTTRGHTAVGGACAPRVAAAGHPQQQLERVALVRVRRRKSPLALVRAVPHLRPAQCRNGPRWPRRSPPRRHWAAATLVLTRAVWRTGCGAHAPPRNEHTADSARRAPSANPTGPRRSKPRTPSGRTGPRRPRPTPGT